MLNKLGRSSHLNLKVRNQHQQFGIKCHYSFSEHISQNGRKLLTLLKARSTHKINKIDYRYCTSRHIQELKNILFYINFIYLHKR